MVAPISAPMLQIVAIPREGVGEETTGVNEKVQGHPILQKSGHRKGSKAKRDQGISHRNLIPPTDYIMAGSTPNISCSACHQTSLQGRSWKLH